MDSDSSALFFITIAFICIWIVMDSIFGRKYMHIFLANVFPFYSHAYVPNQYVSGEQN